MLQQGVFDILQPEVMLAGGISDVRKIGVLAEAFDRQVTPHCAIEEPIGTIAALHLVASWPRGNLLELDPANHEAQRNLRILLEQRVPATASR